MVYLGGAAGFGGSLIPMADLRCAALRCYPEPIFDFTIKDKKEFSIISSIVVYLVKSRSKQRATEHMILSKPE